MGNNVVDILIKIKRVGEQEIKKTIAELKNIGKSDDVFSAPIKKLETGLLNVKRQIGKISDSIESGIRSITAQTSSSVNQTTKEINGKLLTSLAATAAGTAGILSIGKIGILPLLQQGASIIKSEYLSSLAVITSAIKHASLDVWGLLSAAQGIGGVLVQHGLLIGLIKTNLTAGRSIVKTILGMGTENFSTLERISRIVFMLERSLFVSDKAMTHIGSSLGWISGAVVGIMNGFAPWFLAIQPAVNSIVQAINKIFLQSRLRMLARMGNSMAQMQLIFLSGKKILSSVLPLIQKHILPLVQHYMPRISQALGVYLSGLPKVEGLISKIARGIFSIVKAPFKIAGGAVKLLDKGLTALSGIGSKTTVYPMRPQAAAATTAAATPGPTGKSNTITKMLSEEFSPERMQEILRRVFKVLYKGTKEEFAAYFAATKVDLQQLFLNFRKVAQQEALKTPRALGKVILQGLFAGATADKQAISKDVQKIFGGLAESLKAQGKKIPEQLAQGFQSGAKTFNNEFKKAAGDGVEYYPQSPAKKGPLKNLISMGKKIPEQLAQGMNAGRGVIARVTGVIAETIAKFFPRSPALLGPLVYLVSMGLKIPFYLGVGIAKGAFHLLAAVGALVKKVVAVLGGIVTKFNELSQKFGDLSRLAKRVDFSMPQITSLEYAFATVGESVTGLEFVLQSLNKSVATGFSDEDLAKILKLGVNLDAVRNSANPTLEILYQLADVLKNNAVTSKQYQMALELLQQTAGSKLVDVLAKGRDGLQELQREGVKAGAVLSDTTGAALQKYNELRNKLELLKNRYFTWAIDYFLPLLNSTLETLYASTLANSNKIKAYVLYVYNILAQIGKLLTIVFFDVMKDPGAALERIKNALVGLFNFAVDSISINLDLIFAKIRTFITVAVRFLFESSLSMLEFMMPSIWAGISPILQRIFEFITRSAIKAGALFVGAFTLSKNDFDDMVKIAQGHELMLENAAKAAAKTRREVTFLLREAKKIEARTGKAATMDDMKVLEMKLKSGEITIEASYFEDLIDKFNSALADASTGFDFDAAKKTVVAKFQALLVGVVSPETRAQIEAQMEKINEAIDAKNIEKTIEELKKLDEQVAANATNVEKAGDKVVAGVEKTYARIPGVLEKASRDVTIALGRFAKKLAEGGNSQFGTGSEVEGLELKARQEEELAGFKKLQEEKRDLAWGSLQSQHDKALFLMNEEKELKKFEAMQAAETAKAQADEWSKAWSKAVETVSASISNLGTMFDDLYEMSKESIKEFFYASKAAAIAQTIMKTAESVMSALAQGGPYLGPAMAATAAAMGTVQVAKITSQALGYEKGGLVTGGSGTKDDVPALLSRGEFVLRNDAVKKLGKDYLERLNRGVQIPMPKFAAGGMVGSLSATTGNKSDSGQSAPVINIANIVDPQQVARYFASSEGKRAFVNMVSDNAPRVKAALGAR